MTRCAEELHTEAQRDWIATKSKKILADFQAGVCLSLQASHVSYVERKGIREEQREGRNSDTSVLYFTILSLSLFIKYGTVESSVINELKIK
jgi:hypothetical protein